MLKKIKSIIRAIRQRLCRHNNMKLDSYRNDRLTGCIIANFECKKCLKVTQVSIDARDFDLLNRIARDNQQFNESITEFARSAAETTVATAAAAAAFRVALSAVECEGAK